VRIRRVLQVKNVAEACVRCKVGKLVVISSGAVTKPESIGYKVTNLFGNIMDFKMKGEDALRAAYSSAGPSLHYTIVRPGGLKDGPSAGPAAIEVNQGDFIIGELCPACSSTAYAHFLLLLYQER
jgi:nucleoside-diphosphate-sugar epimerase